MILTYVPPQSLGEISTPGLGRIARWSVNDVCTRVWTTSRSGKKHEFRLRQYEFQNGDHFLKSLLAIGPHTLFVTHQHGAFLVSDRGRVLRELSSRPPISFEMRGHTVERSKLPEGPYDYWLWARGWNGRTILATDAEADRRNGTPIEHGYAVLIDTRLIRTRAFEFGRDKIVGIRAEGTRGWRLTLQDRTGIVSMRVGNNGDWRWLPRTASLRDKPLVRLSLRPTNASKLAERKREQAPARPKRWAGEWSGRENRLRSRLRPAREFLPAQHPR